MCRASATISKRASRIICVSCSPWMTNWRRKAPLVSWRRARRQRCARAIRGPSIQSFLAMLESRMRRAALPVELDDIDAVEIVAVPLRDLASVAAMDAQDLPHQLLDQLMLPSHHHQLVAICRGDQRTA